MSKVIPHPNIETVVNMKAKKLGLESFDVRLLEVGPGEVVLCLDGVEVSTAGYDLFTSHGCEALATKALMEAC